MGNDSRCWTNSLTRRVCHGASPPFSVDLEEPAAPKPVAGAATDVSKLFARLILSSALHEVSVSVALTIETQSITGPTLFFGSVADTVSAAQSNTRSGFSHRIEDIPPI